MSPLIALLVLAPLSAQDDGKVASTRLSGPTKVAPGKAFTLVLKVSVESGFHIYGPEKQPISNPSRLKVKGPAGYTLGAARWPQPGRDQDGQTIHEGDFEIRIPVRPGKSAKKGRPAFSASLTYQGCNERVCYPAETAVAKTTVRVE